MPNRIPTLGSRTPAERNREYDRGRRANDAALRTAATIRSSRRWQDYRIWVLRHAPLCCDPMQSHVGPSRYVMWPFPRGFDVHQTQELVAATDVHHVHGLATRPDLAYVLSNTAPLCRRCHNAIEARVRQGEDTTGLFAAWRELAAKIDERTIGFC